MDAQSTLDHTAALVALVQSLVRLELVDGHADAALVHAPEVLDENRFLAARDGVDAEFVDPVKGRAVSVVDVVADLMVSCAPHAAALGCAEELKHVAHLLVEGGPERQRQIAKRCAPDGLVRLVEALAADFCADATRAQRDAA
jgi:carboxylate-amine ligase